MRITIEIEALHDGDIRHAHEYPDQGEFNVTTEDDLGQEGAGEKVNLNEVISLVTLAIVERVTM